MLYPSGSRDISKELYAHVKLNLIVKNNFLYNDIWFKGARISERCIFSSKENLEWKNNIK